MILVILKYSRLKAYLHSHSEKINRFCVIKNVTKNNSGRDSTAWITRLEIIKTIKKKSGAID